jgi:hypothetical protein
MSTFSMLKLHAGIFIAALAFAPLSQALHAQEAFAQVNVPFAFETGSGHYPAGVYRLGMETPSILTIKGASKSGFAMMIVVDGNGQRAKRGVAIFHHYGNRYYLNEISATGEGRHLHLQPSKGEKQLETAASKPAPTNVEVALIETAR